MSRHLGHDLVDADRILGQSVVQRAEEIGGRNEIRCSRTRFERLLTPLGAHRRAVLCPPFGPIGTGMGHGGEGGGQRLQVEDGASRYRVGGGVAPVGGPGPKRVLVEVDHRAVRRQRLLRRVPGRVTTGQ